MGEAREHIGARFAHMTRLFPFHIEAMVDRIVSDDDKRARNLRIYFSRKCSGTSSRAITQR